MEQMKVKPREIDDLCRSPSKGQSSLCQDMVGMVEMSENWPFSRGYMKSEEARGLRMAITMPRSANHHQGKETPSVK